MMRQSVPSGFMAAAFLLAATLPLPALAQDAFPAPSPELGFKQEMMGDHAGASVDSDLVTGAIMTEKDMLQYCVNISDMAREARYSIIQQKLEDTQVQIDEKLVSLDEKLKAIKEYVEIREQFRAAAKAQVVSIYEAMRPDAAAKQMSELDTGMAAAIIMKLNPKISSGILTEMKPDEAASIARYLAAAMQQPEDQQASK